MKLNRTIEQWRGAVPSAMATEQSAEARMFAFKDAREDILRLHEEVESFRAEIDRLLVIRNAEADRLDFLLVRLPGNAIRDVVGELSDTRNAAEWRRAIDNAMAGGNK